MALGDAAHDHFLAPSERTRDRDAVALADLAVRLGALSVDVHLAARAGALRLRSRLEETGDVEPDVEAGTHVFHYARWVLATILRKLGLDVEVDTPDGADVLDSLADALEHMDPGEARRVAAFAYLLSRVAHADHDVTEPERAAMEQLLVGRAGLAADRASIVLELATSRLIHVRGTQDFLVTRELAGVATIEEKRALIAGLFEVCAADGLISTVEDNEIRRVASEIGLEHREVVSLRQRYRDRLAVLRAQDEPDRS